MLKIKDNIDLKELEEYGIYPHYIISNEYTEETEIDYYETRRLHLKCLEIKKKKYRYTRYNCIDGENFKELNCDLLYDLIKADLVEKVKK